jgi:hypothetical protein
VLDEMHGHAAGGFVDASHTATVTRVCARLVVALRRMSTPHRRSPPSWPDRGGIQAHTIT